MPEYDGRYVKEFDLESYKKNDPIAKAAMIEFYQQFFQVNLFDLKVPITERSKNYPVGCDNYKGDLIYPKRDIIVEVERVPSWKKDKPYYWKDFHVFERKLKYAEDGHRVIYWSLNASLTYGWFCTNSHLHDKDLELTGFRPNEKWFVINPSNVIEVNLNTGEMRRANEMRR